MFSDVNINNKKKNSSVKYRRLVYTHAKIVICKQKKKTIFTAVTATKQRKKNNFYEFV